MGGGIFLRARYPCRSYRREIRGVPRVGSLGVDHAPQGLLDRLDGAGPLDAAEVNENPFQ